MNNEKKAPVRQIKFRGLRVDGKGWVYGYLTHTQKHFPPCIHVTILEVYEVIPETVGQFTEILDKNCKEVYEGDKLKYNGWIGEVMFSRGAFFINYKDDSESEFLDISESEIEVIGNIHEESEVSNG